MSEIFRTIFIEIKAATIHTQHRSHRNFPASKKKSKKKVLFCEKKVALDDCATLEPLSQTMRSLISCGGIVVNGRDLSVISCPVVFCRGGFGVKCAPKGNEHCVKKLSMSVYRQHRTIGLSFPGDRVRKKLSRLGSEAVLTLTARCRMWYKRVGEACNRLKA